MSLAAACRRVKLVLSDVDGVMTNGGVTFDSQGVESKTFNIHDGLGIRLWRLAGGEFGVVTGRESAVVAQRCQELGVEILQQGVSDKLPVVQRIAGKCGVELAEIAYLGDDLADLAPIRAVGLGVAVADAAEEVRAGADYVTSRTGGRGAVRELVELILKNSDRWDAVIAKFG